MTNSSAKWRLLMAVMSHGPLMPLPEMVSRTWPQRSSTSRQPALAVADMPSVVGRLPTTTQPPCRMDNAVVRPIPPGQAPGRCLALIRANVVLMPPGDTWTIVVPVPWRFVLLLKLLIRTLPRFRLPWLRPTTATPYGLTSPLPGTVDAMVESL